MSIFEKILFSTVITNTKDLDLFIEEASEELSFINIKTKKRIISCSIELIQNNTIHNQSELKLSIISNKNYYEVGIIHLIDMQLYENLKQNVDTINKMSLNELKEKYKKNIITNTNNSTGNGLIFCRLKSENKINISFKNNKLTIAIKFDKYENDN